MYGLARVRHGSVTNLFTLSIKMQDIERVIKQQETLTKHVQLVTMDAIYVVTLTFYSETYSILHNMFNIECTFSIPKLSTAAHVYQPISVHHTQHIKQLRVPKDLNQSANYGC